MHTFSNQMMAKRNEIDLHFDDPVIVEYPNLHQSDPVG
jgi:hypothetical protein